MIKEHNRYWYIKGYPTSLVYTTAEGVEKFNQGEIFFGSLFPFEDCSIIKIHTLFLTPVYSGIVKMETRGKMEKVIKWNPPQVIFSDGSTSKLSDEMLEYFFKYQILVESPEEAAELDPAKEIKQLIELLHSV